MNAPIKLSEAIIYPVSDGKPMAESSKQAEWIMRLFGSLRALYRDDPNVFIAADNFWYPVEGQPELCFAPDVYVVFGRPKGDRGSYMQWKEDNIPLTVVFEILSPGNTVEEMDDKHNFYEDHGVEEYYVYNPEANRLKIFLRHGTVFRRVRPPQGFVSPRMKISFDLSGPEMIVRGPDGQSFLLPEEWKSLSEEARLRAEEARLRAEEARRRAEEARLAASRLAELGRKARRGQASTEEIQELDRLEEQSLPPEA